MFNDVNKRNHLKKVVLKIGALENVEFFFFEILKDFFFFVKVWFEKFIFSGILHMYLFIVLP